MIAMKRILVPTDFSEPANLAITYGRELARQFGAALYLLHVVDVIGQRCPEPGVYSGLGGAQTALEEAASEELNGQLTDEDRRLGGQAVVLTATHPVFTIVAYATDIHADVIVLGTHNRSAMSRLFLGAVTERLVRTAPCPVLTVRHPERDFVRGKDLALMEQHA